MVTIPHMLVSFLKFSSPKKNFCGVNLSPPQNQKKKKKRGSQEIIAGLELGCFLVAGGGILGLLGQSSRSASRRRQSSDGLSPWAPRFLDYGKDSSPRPVPADVDVGSLLRSLATKHGRKYSLETVRLSLEAILQRGISTTQASEMYGINRSTLQFYLKKLNVVRRRSGFSASRQLQHQHHEQPPPDNDFDQMPLTWHQYN